MSQEEEKKGDVAAKISACLLGAFVADAACMGLEWIYDPNEMRTTVDSVEEPEFKDPPAPRYFSSKEFPGHYGPGMLSPYGEQLLFVAEYCAGAGYDLNKKDMFQKMKDWSYSFGGRPDHALLTAVKACEIDETNCMGSNDDQGTLPHAIIFVVYPACWWIGGNAGLGCQSSNDKKRIRTPTSHCLFSLAYFLCRQPIASQRPSL